MLLGHIEKRELKRIF